MVPVGVDSETHLILPGNMAPRLVCVSVARRVSENKLEEGLHLRPEGLAIYRELLVDPNVLVVIHNAPFDLAVACNEDALLLPLVFNAYEMGRVCCTLVLQKLIDVALGMRKYRRFILDDGRQHVVKSTYSLADLIQMHLDEHVEKKDTWRLSYAHLDGIPLARWPASAKEYAGKDAVLHLRLYEAQRELIKQFFEKDYGDLPDQIPQQRAAWALHLMSMWGLRAENEAVDRFVAHCESEIEKMKEDLAGTGILKPKFKCGGKCLYAADVRWDACPSCGARRCRPNPQVGVRDMMAIRSRVVAACNRLQIQVPMTDPTEKFPKGQVQTDKEALEATDDPSLHVLATQMTFVKHLGQWGPVCRAAVERPVCCIYDSLVETGRTSAHGDKTQEGSNFQNPPRKGDVRPCFVSRPRRVLCSTDADTIELRAHSQDCIELVGWSKMAEALWDEYKNGGPDLHMRLGAALVGIDAKEAAKRRDDGDQEMEDARQFAKCFHPDVEILTRRGWVRVADVTMDDEVASVIPQEVRVSPKPRVRGPDGRFPQSQDGRTADWWRRNAHTLPLPTMEVVWAKPERLTVRKATDGLLHLRNESIDLRVTPDHRMLAYTSTRGLKVVEAREFGKQRGFFNAGTCFAGQSEVDERLLRLAVATQADGNYIVNGKEQPKIRFGFSKERKIKRMALLLREGEYERKIYKNGKNRPTTVFWLTEQLSGRIKVLLDKDKTLPWWWLDLRLELREVVLEEARNWDAEFAGKGMVGYVYYSTIRKNCDVLQALAVVTNRKAQYHRSVGEYIVDGERHCQYSLSIKRKYDSRGEKVDQRRLAYDGDVHCLTVSSGHVLVRDGGMPVITLQCPNFGFPGGLGPTTMVVYAAGLLDKKTHARWFGVDHREQIAKAKLIRNIWFETWPENREYFAVVAKMLEATASEDGETGVVQQLLSGRIRGGIRFTAAANGFFQGRVADAMKEILWKLAVECYTGRCVSSHAHGGTNYCTHAGRSILVGSRPILFLHDEPILEHPEDGTESDRAERQRQIVVECLERWMPYVPCTSSAVLMRRWQKGAKPLLVGGKLVPVKPEKFVLDGKEKVRWVHDRLESDVRFAT